MKRDLSPEELKYVDRDILAAWVQELQRERANAEQRIEKAHEALAIEEFDGDSCPDLETTVQYVIGRYRAVCKSEAEAADRVQELRIRLDRALQGAQPNVEITDDMVRAFGNAWHAANKIGYPRTPDDVCRRAGLRAALEAAGFTVAGGDAR